MGHAQGFLVKGLPKYQHVERMGHEDVEGLLDKEVYVQEKIDGANLTVALHHNETVINGENHHIRSLVIASRNNALSVGGEPDHGFNGAVEYVLAHPGIVEYLRQFPRRILRGEWLVRHSLNYDADKMGKFYVFDVQTPGMMTTLDGDLIPVWYYIDPYDYEPDLAQYSIDFIKTQARGVLTLERLVELSTIPSDYNLSITREGIIVKRTDFVNKFGRTTWGKIVTADFQEKKHLHTHSMKHDPQEMRFAALTVSRAFVVKTIHSVAENHSETPRIQHMGEVIGRVWHDIFQEELWDFVKKYKIQGFHFGDAQRCVTLKTRDIALAFYNGLPEGFNVEKNVEKNQGGGNGDVQVRATSPSDAVLQQRGSDVSSPAQGKEGKEGEAQEEVNPF